MHFLPHQLSAYVPHIQETCNVRRNCVVRPREVRQVCHFMCHCCLLLCNEELRLESLRHSSARANVIGRSFIEVLNDFLHYFLMNL